MPCVLCQDGSWECGPVVQELCGRNLNAAPPGEPIGRFMMEGTVYRVYLNGPATVLRVLRQQLEMSDRCEAVDDPITVRLERQVRP